MSDWRSYQALRDATAEVIKIRQQGNKDIIEPTAHWKAQLRGASDPMMEDKQLRELSPGDQASLRLSGQATASAALSSLDQERQYRERLGGTTMDRLSEMYGHQINERQIEADQAYKQDSLSLQRESHQMNANIQAFQSGMALPYPGVGGHKDTSGPKDQTGSEGTNSKIFNIG